MKKLSILFLLFFVGCSYDPPSAGDKCIDTCAKINREFVNFNGKTNTCTCGEKINKECK